MSAGTTPYSDQPVHSGKLGLDDYAFLKGVEAALSLIENALDGEAWEAKARAAHRHPYSVRDGAIWKSFVTKAGVPVDMALTTFLARIVAQVIEADGISETRFYEIEGAVNGEVRIFIIHASEFRGLAWIATHLGKGAIILPPIEDREVAAAIQLVSPEDAPVRVRYVHTGWIQHNSADYFLDAKGAVGAQGRIDGIDVAVPPQLQNYVLEDPGSPEALVMAVRASLAVTEVATLEVSVLIFVAPYQAVLDQPPDSTFFNGLTGSFKTTLTALGVQHFGRNIDHLHLTESFASTINALRELAFRAKDVLIAVDDYSRPPDHHHAADIDTKADALFRGAANRAARSRAARDGNHPPRAAIISSGTQLPVLDDVQARLTIVRISKNTVNREALSLSQETGARGLFAQSLFGFVRWLASDRQRRLDWFHQRTVELRKDFLDEEAHPRTAFAMAAKMATLELVLEYACDVGALNDAQVADWNAKFKAALIKVAQAQNLDRSIAEPAECFVHRLRDALAAGRGHITSSSGDIPPPELAPACGWKKTKDHNWIPGGPPIGWLDGVDDLYLNPAESLAVVQRLSQDMKQPLLIGERDLRQRLLEAGYLVFDEKAKNEKRARNTLTVRKVHQGVRTAFLHLDAPSVLGTDKGEGRE